MAQRAARYGDGITPDTYQQSVSSQRGGGPWPFANPQRLTALNWANWITENYSRESTGKAGKALAPIKNAISNGVTVVAPLLRRQSEQKHFHFERPKLQLGSHPLEARTTSHSTHGGKVSSANPLRPPPLLPADPANPWRCWLLPGNGSPFHNGAALHCTQPHAPTFLVHIEWLQRLHSCFISYYFHLFSRPF